MADLHLVPVERLTRGADLFRCAPFSAVLSARACLARQGATYDGGRTKGHAPATRAAHPTCARCELGAQVAARVQQERAPGCTVCGVPVTGAKGRAPRCPLHRGGRRG